METVLCAVVGVFFTAGIYLLLSRHLVRVLLGVVILGNAVNLVIFTAGRLTTAAPPVLSSDGSGKPEAAHSAEATRRAAGALADQVAAASANPLPQALILTAIVISFSIFAFLLVLTFRAYQVLGTDNMNEMRVAEPAPRTPPLGY